MKTVTSRSFDHSWIRNEILYFQSIETLFWTGRLSGFSFIVDGMGTHSGFREMKAIHFKESERMTD